MGSEISCQMNRVFAALGLATFGWLFILVFAMAWLHCAMLAGFMVQPLAAKTPTIVTPAAIILQGVVTTISLGVILAYIRWAAIAELVALIRNRPVPAAASWAAMGMYLFAAALAFGAISPMTWRTQVGPALCYVLASLWTALALYCGREAFKAAAC
jgi:hypothetical protein